MKSKTILAVVVSQLLLLSGIGTVRAAITLRLSADNGTNWVVVEDNGPLDSDATLGSIVCYGPIPGWALSISAGQGSPFVGTPDVPDMSLLTINTSGSSATLIAQLSADDLTTFPSQTYIDNLSVDADGTIINNCYYDSGNVLFGTTRTYSGGASGTSPSATAAQMFSVGPVSGFSFVSNGIVVSATGSASHSVTLETIINHTGAQSTSVTGHLFANPQPGCSLAATALTNVLVNAGATVVFSTTASGTGPFSYSWFHGTNALPMETNSSLTLASVSSGDSGDYSVVVANGCANVTNTATLQVNNAPSAQNQSLTLNEDSSTNVTLQATDADSDPLTFTIVTPPAHGILTNVARSNQYTYVPDTNYFGSDSFTFIANDGHADSAPATVSITVLSENDAPELTVPGSQSVGDAMPLVFDTNRLISISDVDAGAAALELSLSVAHGTVTLSDTNGLVLESGSNGSTNIVVQGDLAHLNAGISNLTYQSDLHFSGTDNLLISVNDLGNSGDGGPLSDSESIAISVFLTNHPPVFVSIPVTNATSIPLRSTQNFNRTTIDLSTWRVLQYGPWGQGPADWTLSQTNTTATQQFNADASVLVSDVPMFWDRVEGDFLKFDTTDNDFIGFVFGYENSSNYYLFDWKQETELAGAANALVGMSVKVITADPQVVGSDALWSTFESNPALAHTLYHNSIPYGTSVAYHFMLDFRPGDFTIQVTQGTNLLADIHLNDTSYPLGKFGFYNFSQAGVFYTGFNAQRIAADSYAYAAAASDLDGDTLTYSLIDGPTNMTVNATNGLVQWLPDTSFSGTVTVTIQVSDAHGGTALQTFPIFVPVPLINKPPFVNPGPNRAFAGITNAITLNGSILDDDVPTNGPLTVSWSKLFGPGNVTFGNSNAPVTTALFSTAGFYRLQLVGSDSLEFSTNTVDVRADMLCTAPPPTNIVAWFPGNLDARDVITGTTGLLQNVTYTLGEVGPAFSFSGSSNFVRWPAQPSYDVGAGPPGFTLEFWLKPASFQNGSLLGWSNGVRIERFTGGSTGDSLHCFVTGTNAAQFVNASNLWLGSSWTWTHVALTYDASTGQASVYANGVLAGTANVGTNILPTSGDFYLGQVPASAGAYGGALDEISVYSRPLNAEEIYQIFAAGLSGKCPEDNNVAPDVFAGPDLFVRGVPGTATLQGEVTDDGLPASSQLHSHWSVFSGPGTVSFVDSNSPTSSATFSTNGVYVLQLTADDGEAQASDFVEVRVEDFCSTENPSGLVAWWPANGIDHDAINGYDAIRANGANYAAGRVASAFNFDGTNDYVLMPAQTNYDVGAGASGFSVEFWLNAAHFQNGSVLGWANGVRAERFNNGAASGDSLRWYLTGTNTGQFLVSQPLWASGSALSKWSHIVLTYQSSSGLATLYVNGVVNSVRNVGTNLLSTAGDFYLEGVPGSTGFFGGLLDEVSLYSRPLSRLEVISLFVSGSVGKCLQDSDLRPQVYAGPDITISSTNVTANLAGFVADDGLPVGSVITTRWQSLNFNPGAVTFGTSNSLTTTATFATNGVYSIQLLADDGEKQGSDFVEVRVGVGCPALDIPGLVAWWPANGNAFDKISGIPAVLLGADYTNGKVAQAFNLHGTNDFVSVLAQTNYDVGQSTNGFSLEFWTRGQFNSGNDRGIWSWNNSGTNGTSQGMNMRHSGSTISCDVRDVNGVDHSIGSGIIFDGSWHHFAVTYDRVAGQLKTYLDGALHASNAVGAFQPDTRYDLQIGHALGFDAGNFNGQFDEIALYNRPLTLTEVQSIFNAGAAGKCITPSNMPPLVTAGPDKIISLPPNTVALDGAVFDDALPSNTLAIAWTYIAGDSTVFFSSTNTAATSVTFTNTGTYTFQLTVSDGQFTTSDTVTITVLPDLRARPTITITAPEDESLFQVPAAGTTNLTITATAADTDGQVTNVEFFVNGASLGSATSSPYTLTAPNLAPATYILTAIATDNDGLSTTSAPITAIVFVDPGEPEVAIFNPADSTIVTAPTNIIGLASSPLLQSWQLRYRLAPPTDGTTAIPTDDTGWTTLATGATSVVSNTLAAFDPTMLLNGIYQVQVVATDLLDRTAYSEVTTLVVDRNLKIGNFTLSFSDLTVPVAGVPIEIVRTYDSRDQRTNDFGVGWSLDIRNVRLQKNRTIGPAWFEDTTGGTFPTYFIDSVNDRDLTVTLANGREYKFTATLSPESQLDVPIDSGTVIYKPTADTYATLESIRGDDVEVSGSIPGPVDLFDVQTSGFYDPTLFKLTTEEGDVYIIDENEGLKSLTDRNGNTLLISTNGVLWTNSVTGGAAVGVTFVRDPQGRISQIIDPQGNALNYTYGTNGSLASFIDRETNTTTFAYTNLAFPHYLTGITDPRGIQAIRTEYDSTGRMVRQTDGAGNVVEFTHDLSNNREVVRDRLGNVTIHEYDDDGNIVRTTDPLGNVTTSKYDANDNLLQQVDALGNTNSYTYDLKGNKLSETDPLGFTTHYTYGPLRTLTSITNPRGFTTTNSYDPDTGELLQEQDPLGNVTSYSYDANGNLLTRTDALGNVMSNLYDSLGHMTNTTVTDAVRGVLNSTSFTYDTNGNQLSKSITRTTVAGPQVLTTSYVYDKNNRLLETTHPDGSTNVTIYALGLNKPAVEIDPLGRQTLHYYDQRGNLTNTIYADGTSESYGYDAENRKIAMIDRGGRLMSYGFDALARMTNTVFADGASSNIVYDAIGRVIATADERGNATHYTYDPNCGCSGRQAFITNALNQVTHRSYDEDANESAMIDALGRTTLYSYDALDRRTNALYADGSFSTTTYDALGRRIAETDQSTNTTQFAYDALGRLIAVTNALGKPTTYSYDEVGSLIAQTDADNHTTTYEYDSMGRRTKRTLPLGQIETYQYDLGGNLTNKTDFNGHTTTYTYDAMSRLLSKTPDAFFSAPTVTFTYTATGQRATMSDAGGATAYFYNSRDWLTNKTWTPVGQASSLSLNYTYDGAGNLASIQSSTAGGTSVAYDYDPLNRLDGVNDAHVGCCTEYGYDAVGNLQSQSYPNGIASTYHYDLLNRLTNLTTLNGSSGLVAKYDYTVAPTGHRLTAAENVVITNTVRTINRIYTYDATYRLVNEALSVTGPVSLPASANVGYTLDDVGNRLSRTTTGFGSGTLASTSSTYDANDRLTSDTYDANGNTTTGHIPAGGTAVTDVYDFEDHLVIRNSGQVIVTCDGDGNRVSKTVGGVTMLFLVDDRNPSGYAQVLEEHVFSGTSSPTLNRLYTYGSDLISQYQWTGSAWTLNFYGYDGHGNVRYLTDTNAAVTDTYDYDAFGTVIAQSGITANNYLYCGEQFDSDLGLYYNRARYLNVDSGRFWTVDFFEGEIEDTLTLSAYLYASDNPINNLDPSGYYTAEEGAFVANQEGTEQAKAAKTSTRAYKTTKRVLCAVGITYYLYQKLGPLGEHLKFGMTQNPIKRYTSKQLGGGELKIIAKNCDKSKILELERKLHETLPLGPEERQIYYIIFQILKNIAK